MVDRMALAISASQAAAHMVAADPMAPDGARGVIVNTASVAAYDGQIIAAAFTEHVIAQENCQPRR